MVQRFEEVTHTACCGQDRMYAFHMGGGMWDGDGNPVDLAQGYRWVGIGPGRA